MHQAACQVFIDIKSSSSAYSPEIKMVRIPTVPMQEQRHHKVDDLVKVTQP